MGAASDGIHAIVAPLRGWSCKCRALDTRLYIGWRMTDFTLDQTRDSFLFREPHGFFDEFGKVKGSSELLLAPLLALQTNLRSAIMVAVIPFQLVYSAVLDKRFNQLVIAARIHEVPIAVAPETEDEKIARDRIAFEKANEEFALEMRDQEVITRHAWSTVNMLKEHLRRDDFRLSAQELLRQTIVMCWGALEIVAGDALRVVLNSRPTTFRSIADARPYRDALFRPSPNRSVGGERL